MSLWTALIGAVVNVALNRLWIPQWGAMGASVATFISYFLVYVIRAATMGRFMKFKMYHIKLAINTVLVVAIAAVMTLYGGAWQGIAVTAGLLAISAVYNFKDVWIAAKQVLSSIRRKKSE